MFVIVSTVLQDSNTFTVFGSNVNLSEAPANGEVVEIKTLSGGVKGDKGNTGTNGDKGQKGGFDFGISSTFPGELTVPFTGTVRRYMTYARSFTELSASVSSAPASNVVINILKNGTANATITIPTGNNYIGPNAISFSVVAGDYLTIDVAGGPPSDLLVLLY